MESMLIGLVLDVGGRECARLLSALAVALLLGLLLVLCVPVALIAAATMLTSKTITPVIGGVNHIMRKG